MVLLLCGINKPKKKNNSNKKHRDKDVSDTNDEIQEYGRHSITSSLRRVNNQDFIPYCLVSEHEAAGEEGEDDDCDVGERKRLSQRVTSLDESEFEAEEEEEEEREEKEVEEKKPKHTRNISISRETEEEQENHSDEFEEEEEEEEDDGDLVSNEEEEEEDEDDEEEVDLKKAMQVRFRDTEQMAFNYLGLTSIPHQKVLGFPNLRLLKLCGNELTAITESDLRVLSRLSKLETLVLDGNQIESISPKIAEHLGGRLVHLSLKGNRLKTIPVELLLASKMPKLRELNLEDNPIEAIPEVVDVKQKNQDLKLFGRLNE